MNSYQRRQQWRRLRFGMLKIARASERVSLSMRNVVVAFEGFQRALENSVPRKAANGEPGQSISAQ